jgi:hypothetical protein
VSGRVSDPPWHRVGPRRLGETTLNEYLPWLTLALLGAFHGLNPGMGWLFAVALGLQERRRVAVVRALGPIAVGHAASVAAVLALLGVIQFLAAPDALRYAAGLGLLLFGVVKLGGGGAHPRWVGMRVTSCELVGWSCLMATAHGAGLMLVPVLLRLSPDPATQAAHAAHLALPMSPAGHAEHAAMLAASAGLPTTQLLAVAVHTAAMFVVMGAVALVVYDRLGLAILRRAWFNVDRLWAGALVVAGALTFVL